MNPEKRKKMLLIVTAIMLGLKGFDYFLFTPMIAYYQETAETIKALEESLQKGKILMDREPFMRKTWADMHRDDLPENITEAEYLVIRPLDAWVTESGLQVISSKLQWNETGENYTTLECYVIAQGTLEQVTRFLYLLETHTLPLNVENLEISDMTGNGEQLRINLRFSGIRLLEETS